MTPIDIPFGSCRIFPPPSRQHWGASRRHPPAPRTGLSRSPTFLPLHPKRSGETRPTHGTGNGVRAWGLALGLLLLPVQTWGMTYYVAPHGDDFFTCQQAQSPDTPRRSVDLGVACLTGGDTLDIRGGTYGTAVTVDASKSGTAEQPTVIRGHEGETVLLNPSTSGGAGSILWVYGSYITVSHLTIDGANLPSGSSNLVGFGETSGMVSHHLVLADVEVKNLKGQGSACVTSYGANHTDIIYRRLRVHDCGTQVTQPNPGAHCMYIPGTRYTVENSEIYNCYTEGIQMYPQPEGTVVSFSRIHHTGAEGILVSGDHSATIGRNVVYATGDNPGTYGTTAAIKGNVSGQTIAHNTIYDCPLGLAVTAGSGLRAQNNIIHACQTDVVDEGSGNTLDHNICDATVGDKCTAGDPDFINAPGGDFHLGPNSDAIDFGATLSTQTAATRARRATRAPAYAGAAPDVGAYETITEPCSRRGD